jgi:hypothetical protein
MMQLISCVVVLGAVMLGTNISVAQTGRPKVIDIKDFVRQVFIHGVPYNEANKYDSSVVPTLLEMLVDQKEEAHWANIAVVLEIIGDERAVDPLIAFIEKRGEKDMSRSVYVAKTSALMGLGYLINKTGNEKALNYLKQSSVPETWQARGIGGISPFQASMEESNRDLSKYAIFGLALSGHPSAAEHLQALQKPGDTEARRAFQMEVRDVVSEGLKTNREIARDGLASYYRKSVR